MSNAAIAGDFQRSFLQPAQAAKAVLKQHWPKLTVPVDPWEISQSLGCSICSLPENESELSGKYEVSDGIPTLFFNLRDGRLRQRFTIAHELGHHVLDHPPSMRDPAANYSASYFQPREVAANKFAAELLMPYDAMRVLVFSRGMRKIEDLARQFDVSQMAMLTRLKSLGWV